MNPVIRAFIAIEISSEIKHRIDQISTDLQHQLNKIPIRWVRNQNIHVSLKFLGDISVSSIEKIQELLSMEAAIHPSFEISIENLGVFPNKRRPRVIWIGAKTPPELDALYRSLEKQFESIGFPREQRPFTTHLTLARVARNASNHDLLQIGNLFDAYQVGSIGTQSVDAIHLYKSDLKPSGAEYTRLFSAILGGS